MTQSIFYMNEDLENLKYITFFNFNCSEITALD